MQAIRMEGGLVKTILEIVAELCQLLTRHPHGRLALKTLLRLSASIGARKPLMEVGLWRRALTLSPNSANCLQAILMDGGLSNVRRWQPPFGEARATYAVGGLPHFLQM